MKKILLNKYVIALLIFLVLLIAYKSNGIIRIINQRNEIKQLEKQKKYYRSEIDNTKKAIEALQYDTAMLEQYAREKYFMKKSNEDVYVIIRKEQPEDKK